MSEATAEQPRELLPSSLSGVDMRIVAVLVFTLHAILVFPLFIPSLSDVGQFDEANYVFLGSSLTTSNLPALNQYPAVAVFYALTYLPVRESDLWLVYSCALGRFLLFSLLWISSYLVATKISRLSSPLIMAGLVLLSPALGVLIRNGSHALFAAVSAFAISRLLSFNYSRELKDLWAASALVGLSLLCRFGEGTLLTVSFLAVSAVMGIWTRRVPRTLTAAVLPCVAIVGGYMLAYYSVTGKSALGGSYYFYLAFEEGHGMAYQDKYVGRNFFVEGTVEARQLFGTSEENDGSVLKAIRRNPTAYLRRLPRLARFAARFAIVGYGGPVSIWLFLLALQGCIELVKRREFMVLGILLSWLSYLLIYLLLVFQDSHLSIPFTVIFCLASVGIASIGFVPRNQQYVWSALLIILVVLGVVRNTAQGLTFSPLILLITLWIIWLIMKRYGNLKPVAVTAVVFLLGMMSVLSNHASSESLRTVGIDQEEQALIFLKRNFAENSNIAAYSPNIPKAARMKYQQLNGIETRSIVRSDEDLQRWMIDNKVDGFYVDELLRRFEPSLWALIEDQIGERSTVAFSSESPYIRILRVDRK